MHATEQEEPEVIEARKNYKVWLWSVLAEKLVFIDETGMRLNMTRSHQYYGQIGAEMEP